MRLLVVLIGARRVLYFVESKKPAGGDAEKKDKVVHGRGRQDRRVHGQVGVGRAHDAAEERHRTGRSSQPRGGKPDAGEVSGITSNLASLEIQRVIDENPSGSHGVQPRRSRASRSTFKAGGKDHKLLIGRKTPPGSDLYARLDDQKRVFLIPSFVDTTFNRTTFDLRDKAVLTVNRDEIGSLGVTTPASTHAVREGRAASGS